MKTTLREFLSHLGIDELLGPYDSRMWMADDDDKGQSCTAQINMNAEGDEMDVTIDLVHLAPAPGTPPSEQIMFFHVKQDMNKKWGPDVLRVRKELYHSKVYDWEKKACDFFANLTAALDRSEVPDIDDMIERIFKPSETHGTGTASGGSRKPVIRPEQLLDPTKKF